jgi:hypothetical protein
VKDDISVKSNRELKKVDVQPENDSRGLYSYILSEDHRHPVEMGESDINLPLVTWPSEATRGLRPESG